MAKIPLPERGQPLDLTYVYQIANAVNDIASQVTPTNNKYVTIDTPTAGKQSIKTSEMRVVGAYRDISNKTVIAGSQGTFSVPFSSEFKFPPVVTATVINIGGTDAGRDTSVVLTSVTTAGVEGVVTFNTAGNVSVGVNVIIIGIPN